MEIKILDEENSILHSFLSEIRDEQVQKDRMRFRRNLERIGEYMAFEVSKKLSYRTSIVKTPLGEKQVQLLDKQPYLISILRAALPFYQGFLQVFDQADSGFVGAYRAPTVGHEFGIGMDYISTDDVEGRDLLVIDPMLATGRSMVETINSLYSRGTPRHTYIASVIAAQAGVDYLKKNLPNNCSIFIGSLDEKLDDHYYIVPGLGDAGDLSFGSKL